MLRRIGWALVIAMVSGAVVIPASCPAGAVTTDAASAVVGPPAGVAAGSLADWQKGQWWIDATRLRSWHAEGITGKGVNIALVDGPIYPGIPELQGQDVRPTATTCDRELTREYGPTTPDGPLNETSFHTTSMAALLVGSGKGNGPNGVGVYGVAPGATLRTYAIFNTLDPNAHENLDCYTPALPGLIDRAVADGANIIHIPVAIDYYADDLQAAYNRAMNKGVILVTASGNGGPNSRVIKTGLGKGVLVVGGVRDGGQILDSNPTSLVANWDQAKDFDVALSIHLVAAGADIVGGALAPGSRWDSAVLQNGSSGSSAIVAGQLALMKQKWPTATSNQLMVSLLRSARRPDGSAIWDPRRGFGTTSFQTTLTTDPTAYPDVNPIYHAMGNVFDDHPQKPYIPEQVGSDGYLPKPPPGYLGSSATATTGSATATQPPAKAAPDATPTADGGAWPVWLLGILLAAAALVGGGWALTRRMGPRARRAAGTANGAAKHVQAETAGPLQRRPTDKPGRTADNTDGANDVDPKTVDGA